MQIANTSILPQTSLWQLTDFSLKNVIGRGSYGTVRLGVHKPTNEVYAVKCLRKADNLRPSRVNHIMSEAQILCLLEHPFIIRLCQTFQDQNHLYMIMEYAPGGEVWKHLKKLGRFANQVAKFYAAEVVLALDYLHNQRIIYSDLKPENLMLDAAGHIKLVDFGFAIAVGEPSNCVRGTLEYLAPETVESDGKEHSVMVDFWALGCLIYEMLVGTPPFTDDFFPDKRAVFDKILIGEVVFPWRRVNKQAKAIILDLMCRDPSKRLGSNGALAIQRHPWFKGINWINLLKRKEPAPCLAQQSGLLEAGGLEAATLRNDSIKSSPPLNAQQQELFKNFGPYGSPLNSDVAFPRPEWLLRRQKDETFGAGVAALKAAQGRFNPFARDSKGHDVVSGFLAGDLSRSRSHSTPLAKDRRHFTPLIASQASTTDMNLTMEQQSVFESFGQFGGSPTVDTPTTPLPPAGNLNFARAMTTGYPRAPACRLEVPAARSAGLLGNARANGVSTPQQPPSPMSSADCDESLDDWVYVQPSESMTIQQPVWTTEWDSWVIISHNGMLGAPVFASSPVVRWKDVGDPDLPIIGSAPAR